MSQRILQSSSTDRKLLRDDVEPSYLELHRRGELLARVNAALAEERSDAAAARDAGLYRFDGEPSISDS